MLVCPGAKTAAVLIPTALAPKEIDKWWRGLTMIEEEQAGLFRQDGSALNAHRP